LAPYVQIYIVVCESTDLYKTVKPKIRQWVEARSGVKRSSWLLLYLPQGTQPLDVYQKIYAKLSGDFYNDRSGDRSSIVLLRSYQKREQNSNAPSIQSSLSDFMSKIREGVISSFQLR
jgi:hypothetical protein